MLHDPMLLKHPVLLVAEPLNPGGLAVYTHSIMAGLANAKLRCSLITSSPPASGILSNTELENVQVVDGLFWSIWRPFVFKRLVSWAGQQEPAIIHSLSARTTQICSKLASALNLPFIVTVHHYQNRGGLHFDKRCQGFIAVSESIRENLVNDARLPRDMVRLIPAGISVPKELRARPASYHSGGTGYVPLVSSFGKLVKRKDFETFLRAARIVIDKLGENCSFVISGEGPEEFVLRKRARELRIDKQVTFCHANIAHDVLLRDTDVYVQCSHSEGFGTMVLQAMAHGVPVVATSTGGILSLIEDGETGFLIPVKSPDDLAARILNLLTDPELCQRLGESARASAASKFDLGRMMSSTISLYEEAVTAGSTGKRE